MSIQNTVAQAISELLINDNGEVETSLCQCGAITMSSSESISFRAENAPYIQATLSMTMDNCNHCANNWGVDIEDNSHLIDSLNDEIEELELDQAGFEVDSMDHDIVTGKIADIQKQIDDLENS